MGISDDVIGDVIGASKRAKIADASEFIPAYSLYLGGFRRNIGTPFGIEKVE